VPVEKVYQKNMFTGDWDNAKGSQRELTAPGGAPVRQIELFSSSPVDECAASAHAGIGVSPTLPANSPSVEPQDAAHQKHLMSGQSIILFTIGRAELMDCRPDLKSEIDALTNDEFVLLAAQAKEALNMVYRGVLNIKLIKHLAAKATRDSEREEITG
jgi:hypothetical protein